MDIFAPGIIRKGYGTFVVQNITGMPGNPNKPKCVEIFNYPIAENGGIRDLMKIPGVGSTDIKMSLEKGTIQYKLRAQEITILASDIDLLQFNQNQANFLYANGVTTGVQIGPSQMYYLWKQDVQLVGVVDGINLVFTIPSGTFIFDSSHNIVVYKNGVKQLYLSDFYTTESGGVGTGYDTVVFGIPPNTSPPPIDVLTADYYILNK